MKLFRIMCILAIAFMISACSISWDTIKYGRDTNKVLQTAPCVVDTVEEAIVVVAETKATRINIRYPIMFPFDSSVITDDEMVNIDSLADTLKEYPDTNVVINGWASSEGAKLYNSKLSGQRAIAVKSALLARGIAKDRINTIAKGETGIFGDLLNLNRRAIVLDVK